MRTFFILVLFLAAFILVVPNLTAGVDLAPDNAGVAQAAAPIHTPSSLAIRFPK
jgi:hypothetical protein